MPKVRLFPTVMLALTLASSSAHAHGGGGVVFGFSFPFPFPFPLWAPYGAPYPPPTYPPYAYSPVPAVAPPSNNTWYYCPTSKQYYPYVRNCDVQWEAVPATPRSVTPAPHGGTPTPLTPH
jgi:hypothetical protein